MKHYLIEKNFNYKNFLMMNGYVGEREFSHGTIDVAFKECYEMNMKGVVNYFALGQVKQLKVLYEARRVADYEEYSNFNKPKVEELLSYAESILEIFNSESA